MRTVAVRLSTLLIGLTLMASGASSTEAAGLRFTQISAGEEYVCGLTQRGAIYCTGEGSNGQLGDGSQLDRDSFVQVQSDLRFTKVVAAYKHTCAITARGDAYCWGANGEGNLGDGTNTSRLTPVKVLGISDVTDLALNSGTGTCALTERRGVYCWGYGGDGTLGNGAYDNSSSPVAVSGGKEFATISTQEDFACSLTQRGSALCWGYNRYSNSSQLGIGSTDPAKSNVPLRVLGEQRFTQLEVGSDAACGLTARGVVYCWGEDDWGSIGGGVAIDGNNVGAPQRVLGGVKFAALSHAGGEDHLCALTSRGAAYCWGGNRYGQLGTGDYVNSNEIGARPVAGGIEFSMISINEDISCGLSSRGQIWCWGDSAAGNLTDGADSNVPVLIE
jgi:alpha-tubulin suppressor-like RCC1 family protein